MRWKLILSLILLLVLAALGGYGMMQWRAMQAEKALARDLELAMNQLEMGNHPRAQANFERILNENQSLPGRAVDDILARLAESYRSTGDLDKAAACWERIRDEFPDSRHVDDALALLAEKAWTEGRHEEAAATWERILTNYRGSDAEDDALLGQAMLLEQEGRRGEAQEAYRRLLKTHPDSDRRADIEQRLGALNIDLLHTGQLDTARGDKIYKVQSGDTLYGISRRENVSIELLSKINGIADHRNLPVGKRLKIPAFDFSIVVDKTDNTLTLFNNGAFFKKYKVRTGKEDWRTPSGAFKITYKKKDPAWNKPGAGTIPAGDPENALGARWMAFEGSSLGIHGTNAPDTIGSYASEGCVGMYNDDVIELYELVPIGTPVQITGRMQTNDRG